LLEGLEIKEVNFFKIKKNKDERFDTDFWTKEPKLNPNLTYEKIGHCLKKSQYGISISMNEEGNGYPIYRMNELHNMFCDFEVSKNAEITNQELETFELQDKDVLFNRTNSFEWVGRTGIYYKKDLRKFIFASYLVRFIPDPKFLLPEYLTTYLNTKYGIKDIKRRARQSVNQTNINPEEVKETLIPLLSLKFQKLIEKKFDKAKISLMKSQETYQQAENLLLEELGLLPYSKGTVDNIQYYLTEHERTNSIDDLIEGNNFVEADLLEEAEFWKRKLDELQKPENYKPENYREIEAIEQEIERLVEKMGAKVKVSKVLIDMAKKHNQSVINLQKLQDASKKNYNEISFSDSFGKTGRIDAEYYQPKYEEIIQIIKRFDNDNLGSLVKIKKSIEPGSSAYQEEGIPFIRVSNLTKFGISNPEIYLNEEKFSETIMPKKDTILMSKDGTVGIAYKVSENMKAVTSGAILHLEINNSKVSPDYLTLVLNSKIVQLQAERDSGGSIIQHWKPSEISEVLIPILEKPTQDKIASLVQESFSLKKQSEEFLELTKKAVEVAIEEGEEKGMEVLKAN